MKGLGLWRGLIVVYYLVLLAFVALIWWGAPMRDDTYARLEALVEDVGDMRAELEALTAEVEAMRQRKGSGKE